MFKFKKREETTVFAIVPLTKLQQDRLIVLYELAERNHMSPVEALVEAADLWVSKTVLSDSEPRSVDGVCDSTPQGNQVTSEPRGNEVASKSTLREAFTAWAVGQRRWGDPKGCELTLTDILRCGDEDDTRRRGLHEKDPR